MHQLTGSSLVQVMGCCLMAPSHYLNQCWIIVNYTLRNKLRWIWIKTQIARFMRPTWGKHGAHLCPVGPRWPHVGPMNLGIREYNTNTFIHKNAYEIVVSEMASILSRKRWVNPGSHYGGCMALLFETSDKVCLLAIRTIFNPTYNLSNEKLSTIPMYHVACNVSFTLKQRKIHTILQMQFCDTFCFEKQKNFD